MSQSESFDAFYARTSWNVTSQVHALAGGDPLADHAIREAYAKAYQQWYEVSTYPDAEAWVLGMANDAYQRRRAEVAAAGDPSPATGHDPLSWPGMFRPARPAAQPAGEATLAPRSADLADPGEAGPTRLADVPAVTADGSLLAGGGPLASGASFREVPPGSVFGSRPADSRLAGGAPPAGKALADGATVGGATVGGATVGGTTAGWAASVYGGTVAGSAGPDDGAAAWEAQPGAMPTATIGERSGSASTSARQGFPRLSQPVGGILPRVLSSRRSLIAVATAVVVLLAAGMYFALGGHKSSSGATPPVSTGPAGKPTQHMLAAGQTGSRSDIPWSLIGPGWTLAEVSTAQPVSSGSAIGGVRLTYLVDPEGGKYRIRTMSGGAQPDLLAWSGNGKEALYAFPGAPGSGAMSYSLLGLATGNLRALPLPAGVTALGFTRPDGLNILAVHLMNSKYRLERYDLAGAFQAAIGTLPRPGGTTGGVRINALSSPDGTTAVWGVSGDGMELVSNAGGLIRKLRVPGAGSPRSCTPVSWWSANSVLTYCNAAGQPDAGRLWVVPAGGGQPTQLTGISGSPSGQGAMTGAWQTGGTVYITSTTFAQCQGAPSGPDGMQILQLGNGGTETAVNIPATTNNHVDIVSGLAGRLLVQAQTSCPGTYSLIWFNPSTHAAQAVLTAPPTEAGVISAVPYGAGEAAAG